MIFTLKIFINSVKWISYGHMYMIIIFFLFLIVDGFWVIPWLG